MKKLIGFKKIKTAVFISGKGSNLENLIKFSKKRIVGTNKNLHKWSFKSCKTKFN